jgi:transglutaminase-like putative cysteine protease
MANRVHTWLRASTAVLVFSGYLALTTVRGYPVLLLWLPALLILLTPLAERMDRRYKVYRTVSFAITVAFGCFIPLMWFSLGILDGVITLTIFIQAYTMLHVKEERNYYHLYLMALFLLLAACVQSPEPAIGLVMAMFMISAIWAFLSLRIHEEMREHEQHELGKIIPVPGARAGRRQANASPIDAGLIVSVTLLSFAALALTVVLFVLTPGVEAGVLGRNSNTIAQTGISQTVDLAGGMAIQNDPSPVMHVGFPDEPDGRYDGAGGLYWRVTTLPRFVRSSWERRGIDEHYEPNVASLFPRDLRHARSSDPLTVERKEKPGARLVRQEIYMDDVPDQGIPALDLVVKVHVQGNPRNVKVTWDGNQDFTVNLTTPGARRISYEVYSESDQPSAETLRAAPANYAAYLTPGDLEELTYQELLPQTRELVAEIVAGQETAYDKAVALNAWLSGPAFEYTLNVPPLPPSFAVDSFINEIRRGHCELFGSALTLMLRSQGIPARVVSGYRGGDWSEPDNAYVVRASMAHLWVEVFFPESGWVTFDPSPQTSLDDASAMGSVRRWLSWIGLRSKMFWYQQVIGFDRTSQIEQIRDLSLNLVQWFQSLDDPAPQTAEAPAPYAGLPWRGIVGGTLILLLLSATWRRVRRRRDTRRLTPDQARAVHLYRQVCRALLRHGLRVEGKTAEELWRDAERIPGIDLAAIREVLDIYLASRFGERRLEPKRYRALKGRIRQAMRLQQKPV